MIKKIKEIVAQIRDGSFWGWNWKQTQDKK